MGAKIDKYRPWLCQDGGHSLTIREVSQDGLCVLCGGGVVFKSSKAEVQKVIAEELAAPDEFVYLENKWRKICEYECSQCDIVFKAAIKRRFCTDRCREAWEQEEALKAPRCIICGVLLRVPDRRWKYCVKESCQDFRRGGRGLDGKQNRPAPKDPVVSKQDFAEEDFEDDE